MDTEKFMQFMIPVLFLVYALLLLRRPPYRDGKGFATKRAQESEKIWNYVQRTAGLICLVMGALLCLSAWLTARFLEGMSAYYTQMGIEIACIALLIPLVNLLTNRKFPKR